MPRRSNQFRRRPSQLVSIVTRSRTTTTTTTSAFGPQGDVGSAAAAAVVGGVAGHLFASGRPRSRWRGRSAGLL
jgi:hypothetical protein